MFLHEKTSLYEECDCFAVWLFRKDLKESQPLAHWPCLQGLVCYTFVIGRKEKIRTHFQFGKSGSDCTGLVPVAGVEPARPCGHGILNPGRLPIPPHRHGNNRNSISDFRSKVKGAIQIIPKYRDNGRLCGEADARSADNGRERKPRQSDENHD